MPAIAATRRFLGAFLAAARQWFEDRCMAMAAAVSFYAAFSLAPTLVIAVAVGSVFFGEEAARGQLFGQLRLLVGEEGAVAVQAVIGNAWLAESIGLKTLVSVVTLLFGASITFAQLNDNVNQLWRSPPPGQAAWWSFVRVRVQSIGLVLGVGFLLVVSLIVDAVLQGLQDVLWGPDRRALLVAVIGARLVSFLFLGLVFAGLIRTMLRQPVRWQPLLVGGFVASGLFIVGRYFFGLYLATAGTADAFGAAGSLAVILMWLFYSASVFLYGVAFARHWAKRRGGVMRGAGQAA
jgi:membrane protein